MKKIILIIFLISFFIISGCNYRLDENKDQLKDNEAEMLKCYSVVQDISPEEFDCTQMSVKEEINRLEAPSTSELRKQNFNVKYYAKIRGYRTDGFILVYEDEFKIEKCICRDTFTSYSGGEHGIERGCEFVPQYLPGDERFESCLNKLEPITDEEDFTDDNKSLTTHHTTNNTKRAKSNSL